MTAPAPADLAALQRALRRWVTHPDGVAAALREGGAAERSALRHRVRDVAPGAEQRLEVYARAYFQRIHDVLAEDLAALRAAAGEDGFHDLVTGYLLAFPPRSFSLRHAAAQLPEYLEAHPAAEPFRRRWPWAADLARLEAALADAFDAADAPPLGRAELAASAPDPAAWEALRLAFQPSLAVLGAAWPVDRWRRQHDAGEPLAPTPAALGPEPCSILVWRRDERVLQRRAEPDEAAILDAARRGTPFGALCAELARLAGEAAAPARAAAWLGRWADEGLLAAQAPDEAAPARFG